MLEVLLGLRRDLATSPLPLEFGDELINCAHLLTVEGNRLLSKMESDKPQLHDRREFLNWAVGARSSATKHQPSVAGDIAYFLAIRLSARVIDFACLLGTGMANPVDATIDISKESVEEAPPSASGKTYLDLVRQARSGPCIEVPRQPRVAAARRPTGHAVCAGPALRKGPRPSAPP
jgi:hypothetical protein